MSTAMMRVAGVETFGEPLRLLEVPIPAPGPGEVLVRVRAAAVNPADAGMVAGRYRWAEPVRFPLVPGYDVAGEDAATGVAVVAFTMHKTTQRGGYAQFVALPADLVVPLPPGADPVAAAALPLAGLTAWQALDTLGDDVRTLSINGRGAVGAFARSLAADRGLTPVDDDGPVDAALDTVGGARAWAAFERVRPGGRYATVVPEFWVPGGPFAPARGIEPLVVSVRYDREQLLGLVDRFARGVLSPAIEAVLPLSEAATAHQRLTGGGRTGKLILRPGR
ncbi:zinc-binding dehydrogenase [Dactylosporangium sp. NPDC051541]|uniref:zinc-binding dehydrogenase n=1 Tax=Dactylosporangium sp. NPDC051541 TaxID=3363977 RepID=UPI0037AAF6F0